jgi:hypothetical protein
MPVQDYGVDGAALEQYNGPVIPEWYGTDDPALGYYADLHVESYTKILMEL